MPLPPETCQVIDRLVAEAQVTGQVPSLVLGVVRAGRLAHVATAGEHPTPNSDIQYRIGSISKMMTATLVMRLRDDDQLALDDPLERYLPGTPLGRVTLRHLLSHTSGLQREPDGEWWERSAGADLDTLLAGLTADKLAFPPRRTYHYSNLAYGLLGAVVERITGQRWWELLREQVLAPLGMARTTYHPVEPFARGYVVHPWHGSLREEPRTDTGAMAPAGQLWSTLADLARWAAFLADPTPAVLAPATLAEMCTPVVMSDLDAWTAGYGLGVELVRVGERVFVGHGGSMPGYLATLAVHRPSRTGVVGFANTYTFRDGSLRALGQRVLTAVLDRDALRPPVWRPSPPPPPEIAALCGRWWWMGREHELSWDAATGELVLETIRPARPGAQRFAPEGPDRWRGRSGENNGEIMTIHRDATGQPVALDIATFVFRRDPEAPAT
ncbi:MAG: serine hydrolase [Actinobacteria bacterium]|nr:MAG: serine hydrolase [Actinomycetota bacterium]